MIPGLLFTLCKEDPAEIALKKWLRAQVGIFATAEMPEQELEYWTVATSESFVISAHALACTGDVPLLPDGFESQAVAYGFKLVANTRTWAQKR